jgi:hypothetical protein
MLATTLLLVYAVLLLAVLLSALAHRTVGCSPYSPSSSVPQVEDLVGGGIPLFSTSSPSTTDAKPLGRTTWPRPLRGPNPEPRNDTQSATGRATIVLSIVAHSSADVFVATQFDEEREIACWYTALKERARRST